MIVRRVAILLLVGLSPRAVLAQGAPAPTGRCVLQFASDHALTAPKLPSGQRNAFTGGNVVARCPAQNLVLRADSLESYGDEGRVVFIGHADYAEPRLKLKAEVITYYQRDERVLAVQNVVVTHDGVSEDKAYAMTKALWSDAAAIASSHPAAQSMDRDTAVTGIVVPLHPGAERYYRETGVLR